MLIPELGHGTVNFVTEWLGEAEREYCKNRSIVDALILLSGHYILSTETVADLGISEGVGAHTEDGIDLGVEVSTSDISKPTGVDAPDLEGTLYDMSHYMSKVPLDSITEFETTQRQLQAGRENLRVRALLCIERDRVDSLRRHMALSQEEFRQVRRDRDDTRRRLRRLESLVERRLGFRRRTMTITRSGMTPEAIEELVNRRVEEALAAYEATRAANALEAESQSQNGSDGDNGNGGNGNGGNGNPNENDRGARPVARECTYQDFMKCQPLNFKGTEGVVGLIRWFEKMEIRTIGADAAFPMSWRELMKLMAEVYCPRIETQKMESEL
ncbi:hypothetical protein Tco_0393381 [Tanacetum coccineum]